MANKKQTAVVVIPTYNEAKVIGKMIEHLFEKTFPTVDNWVCKLLIVDDTSPDGTFKVVEKYKKKYPNLHLYLNKEKAGIGGAYVKGFRYAMKELKADAVIEFDADFQHPPENIPVMLKKLDEGYDYIIGSRKVKGGSNPKGWGFKRVFFSEVGGLVARFVLFFPFKNFFKITDPTTGLKASRVKGFVDKMDMDNLYSKNFGYKLEFLYQMIGLGAKVTEIPLQFGLRTLGESKISGNTAKDVFRSVFLLRWNDPFTQKFLKFGTVGFIGYLINAFGVEIFRNSFITPALSAKFFSFKDSRLLSLLANPNSWAGGLAAEVSIISNYILNNFWTFKKDKITNPLKFISKFLQFNLTSLGAVVIQFVVLGLATAIFGDTSLVRQIALVIAIGFLIIPYNWIMYNKIIWKKK